jgi:hypothetical protein
MKRIVLLIYMVLAACAGPTVDRDTASFDETQYASDLNECRGGNAVTFAFYGLGGAVIGAALGATEGVTTGAIHGDAGDGALYGAVAGSVIGFGLGAYKALEDQDAELRQCLASKGWVLKPV